MYRIKNINNTYYVQKKSWCGLWTFVNDPINYQLDGLITDTSIRFDTKNKAREYISSITNKEEVGIL